MLSEYIPVHIFKVIKRKLTISHEMHSKYIENNWISNHFVLLNPEKKSKKQKNQIKIIKNKQRF